MGLLATPSRHPLYGWDKSGSNGGTDVPWLSRASDSILKSMLQARRPDVGARNRFTAFNRDAVLRW